MSGKNNYKYNLKNNEKKTCSIFTQTLIYIKEKNFFFELIFNHFFFNSKVNAYFKSFMQGVVKTIKILLF
jgi:hypothetical protein